MSSDWKKHEIAVGRGYRTNIAGIAQRRSKAEPFADQISKA
jgi:hypothetical protein